jgi:hypothetical protein
MVEILKVDRLVFHKVLAFKKDVLLRRAITKLSIFRMTPAYARIICTNNMVHATRSHAADIPTTEANESSVKKISEDNNISTES